MEHPHINTEHNRISKEHPLINKEHPRINNEHPRINKEHHRINKEHHHINKEHHRINEEHNRINNCKPGQLGLGRGSKNARSNGPERVTRHRAVPEGRAESPVNMTAIFGRLA